ncbi:MAG: tRNA (adenosine(37)-N6)-dimethylallyltransferase MiaA [Anaeroplasmataceae bacterium]|nr:tRNA (adenosine(37)-N6)-dimethylallyltransferase MiaA [Anaeroplasmataceae bacterium]MDE6413800.1 tRNA (adenosine(37)-N6)-dimethylallyltransferase MiaA [Anaeroplasmataceae bacterium]
MKNKVIVVVGPTAVGKTKLSIRLAKRYGIEIISGDSIAVYKDLNIGSAKPTKEEMDGVVHHLIDILDPKEEYSVADFQKHARSIIDERPLSLICGGTGLYIQATLFNYEFHSKKRDAHLAEQYESYSNEELFALLKKLDKDLDETKIHPNNRKRVLRALEVYEDLGTSIHSFNHHNEALYEYYIVYLDMERELLYNRIHQRVDQMLEDGLFAEVKALADQNIYPKGIGYREWIPYFEKKASYEDVVEQIKKNTRHLAKRQATWFKNQMHSHFYMMDLARAEEIYQKIEMDIDRWLKE